MVPMTMKFLRGHERHQTLVEEEPVDPFLLQRHGLRQKVEELSVAVAPPVVKSFPGHDRPLVEEGEGYQRVDPPVPRKTPTVVEEGWHFLQTRCSKYEWDENSMT